MGLSSTVLQRKRLQARTGHMINVSLFHVFYILKTLAKRPFSNANLQTIIKLGLVGQEITQWILLILNDWIVIYPLDSAIHGHLLNNLGQDLCTLLSTCIYLYHLCKFPI